jgi:hypothetical protein
MKKRNPFLLRLKKLFTCYGVACVHSDIVIGERIEIEFPRDVYMRYRGILIRQGNSNELGYWIVNPVHLDIHYRFFAATPP